MSKIILITGATAGIGKASAIKLSTLGHDIILHGRDQEKIEKVKAEILSINQNAIVDIELADLASLSQVKEMAQRLNDKFDHIDVLINNAGIGHKDRVYD